MTTCLGYWDLANFAIMLPSMPKGEIVGNMFKYSKLECFMVVIHGNILCFADNLQIGCEGKLSKC